MDELIGGLIEALGEMLLRADPEQMPENATYKESFCVKMDQKGAVGFALIGTLLIGGSVMAYLGNGFAFACLLFVPGLLAAVLSFLTYRCYDINEETVTARPLLGRKKVILWSDVKKVTLFQTSGNAGVTIVLFGEKRSLADFSSPLVGFWQILKMAEHLGYEITVEKDASLRKMTRP